MVIVDKKQETARLLFTLKERTTIDNPFYLLVIHSPFINVTKRFQLPENLSQYSFRFDEFLLETTLFKDMLDGTYCYNVFESAAESLDESTMGEPVEIGLFQIVGDEKQEFVSMQQSETENDFVVYTG